MTEGMSDADARAWCSKHTQDMEPTVRDEVIMFFVEDAMKRKLATDQAKLAKLRTTRQFLESL